MEVVKNQERLFPENWSLRLGEFDDKRHEGFDVIGNGEIPDHCKGDHSHKDIFRLQIFHDSVVHEQLKLVSGLDKHSSQQIRKFLDIKILLLAVIDGKNVGKWSVIAHGFEVDESDKNVGELGQINGMGKGLLDSLHLSLDYLFLCLLVFCLANQFYQVAGVSA